MYKNKTVLALILARGGSKGIPRKNLQPLLNKPLIAHSIRQARNCSYVDRVVVSTDDIKIAKVARRYGAETPFLRPKSLAGDHITDFPVVLHALDWLRNKNQFNPDLILFLRPTGPCRTQQQINEAFRLIAKKPHVDSVRSVNIPPQSPYKMWTLKNGLMKPLLKLKGVKEPFNAPRQRLPQTYQTNPNISLIWAKTIRNHKSLTGRRIRPLIINEPCVDIDRPIDFLIAEKILKTHRK